MTWQIVVSALWGLFAALSAYVLIDSGVRWVRAYRIVRAELDKLAED